MLKNLKLLRNEKGISQQQLANILGISQQSINKYENHDVEPDISTLIAMADYFNTSVDFLIGRYDNEKLSEFKIKESEKALINNYRNLNKSEKICVDTLIETYNNIRCC